MSTALNLPAPRIADLIAAERRAFERFSAACKAADEVAIGREPTEAECDEWDSTSDAQAEALEKVVAMPVMTSADLISKIDLFWERRDPACIDAYLLEALFASIKDFVRSRP